MTALCDISLNKYDENELIKKRDEFIKKKIEIAKETLDSEEKAVNQASKDLKNRQDNKYTDEEIDSYLPQLARKNK